jgi:hypothetical protein
MTEDQMLSAFGEATVEHTKDGIMMGLHPVHVANLLTIAAIRLMQDFDGNACAIHGLERALDCLKKETGHG